MRAREDSKVTNSGQARRSYNQAALVQVETETFSKLRSRSHELELGHANATSPGASSHLRLRLLYQTENCVGTSQTRPFGQFNSV